MNVASFASEDGLARVTNVGGRTLISLPVSLPRPSYAVPVMVSDSMTTPVCTLCRLEYERNRSQQTVALYPSAYGGPKCKVGYHTQDERFCRPTVRRSRGQHKNLIEVKVLVIIIKCNVLSKKLSTLVGCCDASWLCKLEVSPQNQKYD